MLIDGFIAVAAGLKADTVHAAIHFRRASDLCDPISQRSLLAEVDNLTAETLGLLQTLRNHIANNDDRGSQQMASCRAGETDWACASDINGRAGTDARRNGAMITGRKDVRK